MIDGSVKQILHDTLNCTVRMLLKSAIKQFEYKFRPNNVALINSCHFTMQTIQDLFSNHSAVKREQIIFTLNIINADKSQD